MGVYDKTLREIFQNIPTTLIKLLTGKKIKRLLDTSFPKIEEREADLVVELDDKEIFHLEIQSVNDKDMPKRMLFYALSVEIENSAEFFKKINKKLLKFDNKKREDYLRKLIILSRLRPNLYKTLEIFYKEYKMPFTLDKRYDPLYKEGWNEAWNKALDEANKKRIEDALIMINKFNLSVEDVSKELNIPKEELLKRLNEKSANTN